MKGEVQREQQMSKRWPLWWQRLRLELKDMPSDPPLSPLPPLKASSPMSTHTHTFAAALMDRLTTEMTQATWSVCHLRILQPPKAALHPPRAVKSSKCVWGGGIQARGRAVQKSHSKAPKQNVPPPDIFRGIYSNAYSSLLFWKFMHIHYFTWLKYPPKPIVSLRVQIQLVCSRDDEPS